MRAVPMRMMFLTAGVACLAASVAAQTPQPFPQFEAKRIGVPKTGDKRIHVQIDPKAQQAALAPPDPQPAAPDVAVSGPPVGQYGWFWDKVSPSIFDVQPGRLQVAMDVIAGSGQIAAPRLQHLQGIAQANGVDILRSTVGTRVSPALVLAVISVESAGKTDAVSGAGAQGLMQLMPDTA
ncbi:MAG: transglycosylase SLT domain-containing protein, partial [Tateyamaria sp.]